MSGRWRFWHRTGRWATSFAQVQFEPRDLWIGVFWRFNRGPRGHSGWDRWHGNFVWTWTLHVYVCLIPCLPLHVSVMRTVRLASVSREGAQETTDE